jgi:hypothetical protein
MSVSTKATVQLFVEIDLPDVWGEECSLSQVFKQAADGALKKMEALRSPAGQQSPFRVIGIPKIVAIATERK